INWRYLVGCGLSCVLQLESDVETAVSRGNSLEVRVGESGVGQTVTEGKQGSDLLLVAPAVTDVEPLAERGCSVGPGRLTLGMRGISRRVVFQALAPGERQTSRWTCRPQQNVGS